MGRTSTQQDAVGVFLDTALTQGERAAAGKAAQTELARMGRSVSNLAQTASAAPGPSSRALAARQIPDEKRSAGGGSGAANKAANFRVPQAPPGNIAHNNGGQPNGAGNSNAATMQQLRYVNGFHNAGPQAGAPADAAAAAAVAASAGAAATTDPATAAAAASGARQQQPETTEVQDVGSGSVAAAGGAASGSGSLPSDEGFLDMMDNILKVIGQERQMAGQESFEPHGEPADHMLLKPKLSCLLFLFCRSCEGKGGGRKPFQTPVSAVKCLMHEFVCAI